MSPSQVEAGPAQEVGVIERDPALEAGPVAAITGRDPVVEAMEGSTGASTLIGQDVTGHGPTGDKQAFGPRT